MLEGLIDGGGDDCGSFFVWSGGCFRDVVIDCGRGVVGGGGGGKEGWRGWEGVCCCCNNGFMFGILILIICIWVLCIVK